ncbi:DNA repair protein RecO [Shewanella amazonensis]|uniref:DNA repair protein RecO n=1 Tax=Shewanella amazonensis (strain ATCC BAA-1098 / SB2B) TaxID=326297 RepID=A1S3Y3_SHEAM|nr:DNA repair protein RecO [Shewanella amazonensis]ABL99089.1 DNA repair protein RecO [Shewanella amazonensis SB2B]
MERGYLLHSRPYRENSAIVNLLVDGAGRVDAIARLGSGKRSSRALLQPFQPLLFSLSGKGELRTLIQPEAYAPAIPLQGDALYAAMYLNELLMRCLSHSHAGEGLFFSYHQTLMSMAKGFCQSQLRYFELSLLEELGACPSLSDDTLGTAISAECAYRPCPEGGLAPSTLEKAISGRAILALAEKNLSEADFAAARQLLRFLLAPFVGNKPLVSRQLFANRNKS